MYLVKKGISIELDSTIRAGNLHWSVFIVAAVKALCSALSAINSAIHAIVKGVAVAPIEDKM